MVEVHCKFGAAFFANRVGDLVRINGLPNADTCREILIHHAIPSGRHLIGPKCILQHNDPKHTAKVRTIFSAKERGVLEVMVWPPQSPDHNIIDSVGDYMEREATEAA